MPYEVYKVLHLLGLFLAIGGIGAVAHQVYYHGSSNFPHKRALMIYHGVGTMLVFVSGFGLMARLGFIQQWPTWIYVKLVIWFLILGGGPSLIIRIPKAKAWSWWLIPALLTIAVSAAVYKDQLI